MGRSLVAYADPVSVISVDGSASSDPNGDPLTFAWTLTPPPDSATTLVGAAQPIVRFTPDVDGYYKLNLTVSDNTGLSSYPATVDVGVFHPAHAVPYYALDAAYSGTLDRVVIVTPEPALRLVNPHDGTSTAVALDSSPWAVSLSPNGEQASVSHMNHFSVVSLVDPTTIATYATTSPWAYDGGDVVLDGRGYAYAFPAYNISALSPLIVKLADHSVSGSAASAYAEASTWIKPQIDVVRNKMYALGDYSDGIHVYDAPAGSLTNSTGFSSTPRQYKGPFLSPDGARVYGGSGDVWSPATLTTIASLHAAGDTAIFDCIQDSTVAGRILAATGGYAADAFRIYDRSAFTLTAKKYAPAVVANAQATIGTVQWVFWKRDGSGYYVVFVTSGGTGIAEY